MKQNYAAAIKLPEAFVCKGKSRRKQYQDPTPTYYLTNGEEFSLELYNPTSETILAKIELDGKLISQSGLVIRPGERVWLERYIDVARKFLFETYEVSKAAAQGGAIANNGELKVMFYREYLPPVYNYTYSGNMNIPINQPCGGGVFYSNTTANNSGILRGTTNITTTNSTIGNVTNTNASAGACAFDADVQYSSSLSAQGFASMDSLLTSDAKEKYTRSAAPTAKLASARKKTVETGRVEAGSASSQNFQYVNKTFTTWPFHALIFKLLPLSQKTIGSEDLNVRRYCHNCGAAQKKEWKFCPSCSAKL